jgi:hypothetical protein
MTFEYEAALSHMLPGGIFMSHDIYSTAAFPDLIDRHKFKFDTIGSLGLISLPGGSRLT